MDPAPIPRRIDQSSPDPPAVPATPSWRRTLKIGMSLTAVLLAGSAALLGQMSADAMPGGKGGNAGGGIGADVAVCTLHDHCHDQRVFQVLLRRRMKLRSWKHVW